MTRVQLLHVSLFAMIVTAFHLFCLRIAPIKIPFNNVSKQRSSQTNWTTSAGTVELVEENKNVDSPTNHSNLQNSTQHQQPEQQATEGRDVFFDTSSNATNSSSLSLPLPLSSSSLQGNKTGVEQTQLIVPNNASSSLKEQGNITKHTTENLYNDACFLPNTNHSYSLLSKLHASGKTSLEKPIVNLGMPKIGSTTLYHFFSCSKLVASHWLSRRSGLVGLCMERVAKRYQKNGTTTKVPLIASCGEHTPNANEALMQMDYASKDGHCVFPQISYLEQIHEEFPKATFILTFRPMRDWVNSVRRWDGLAKRLAKCDIPGLPVGVGTRPGELEQWFCWHVQRVREFVRQHPSHALVELDLYDDPEWNANIMALLFRGNKTCWEHSNAGRPSKKTKVGGGGGQAR